MNKTPAKDKLILSYADSHRAAQRFKMVEVKIEVPEPFAPLFLRGWSVSAAAKAAGCSPPHLRRVLLGERQATAEMRQKLEALPQRKLNLLQLFHSTGRRAKA